MLRTILILSSVLVLLILLAPTILSQGFLQSKAEAAVRDSLRGEVRIGDVTFSWFSGLTIRDLRVDNPPGFPSDRPAVVMKDLKADVSLLSLLFGNPRAAAEIVGLELNVEQSADGTTNLQQLLHVSPSSGGKPEEPTGEPRIETPPEGPDSLAFDLHLRDCKLTIRREGQVLEELTDFQCNARKSAHSVDVLVDARGTLRAGDFDVNVVIDPTAGTADARLLTRGLDLGSWQPLVDSFAPGRITALAGRVDGEITARVQEGDRVELGGELIVDAPRLAGPIIQDMDLRAARWTLKPALTLDGAAEQVDTSAFAIDLEWLRIAGRPAQKAGTAAFSYELDLARLAEFGGPMPAELKGTGSMLTGELHLPTTELPTDAAGWTRTIAADASLRVPALDLAGFALRDVSLDATMTDGALAVHTTPTTLLDGGPLVLQADVTMTDLDRMPAKASLRWQGGQMTGGATQALRYVVPLFAGLDAEIAQIAGKVDLDLAFEGPATKRADQPWLTWLDEWRGSGDVALSDTSFAPSQQLQGLLAPLGPLSAGAVPIAQDGRLRLDAFRAPFSFEHGVVRAKATEWLAAGQKIGLNGEVGFDGRVNYELDLSSLLAGHRDGEKVLKAVGGKLPTASLGGTLDAPSLALPKLENIATKLLEQEGRGLLQKGLEGLFGGKKK